MFRVGFVSGFVPRELDCWLNFILIWVTFLPSFVFEMLKGDEVVMVVRCHFSGRLGFRASGSPQFSATSTPSTETVAILSRLV